MCARVCVCVHARLCVCVFQVGAFLKSPKFPIWILGSETHLSVFFTKASTTHSLHKRPNTYFTHTRHTACNTSQSTQQVRKTKIWTALIRFNKVQVRYQCGGKKRRRRGGEGKMRTGDSHIWPVLFLGFSPIQHCGEKCSASKFNKCRRTHACIYMPSFSHSLAHRNTILVSQPSVIN